MDFKKYDRWTDDKVQALLSLGCIHTCSSVRLVRLVHLVWTKKEKKTFSPGPVSVQIGNFITEPKDTEPKGIGIHSQPDWLDFMTYCLF